MNKIILMIVGTFLSISTFANDPFEMDNKKINEELTTVKSIEKVVSSKEGMTYETLKNSDQAIAATLAPNDGIRDMITAEGGPLNVPSFGGVLF